jgi:hypothetical protein
MATLEQTQVLSTPAVYVDGALISIKPSSVKSNAPGEVTVRAISAGGGSVRHVAGLNAEELKGRVSFTLLLTAEMKKLMTRWRQLSNQGIGVTIAIVNPTSTEDYEHMYMTTAPEFDFSPEGETEVEFEGSLPAIT